MMLRVLPWTAGGELFSFNCADLADWPAALEQCFGRRVVNAYHVPVVPPRPGLGVFFNRCGNRNNVVVSWMEGVVSRDDGRANHRGGSRGDGMDEMTMNNGAGPPGPMRIAIIGAGPAGAALADLPRPSARRRHALRRWTASGAAGRRVARARRGPDPAPSRHRGETAAFSCVKPGVSFIWSPTDRVSVTFNRFAPAVFPYAYNIPRPRFDDALLAGRSPPAFATCAREPGFKRRSRRRRTRSWPSLPRLWRRPGRSVDASAPHRGRHRTGPPRGPRALAIPARLGPAEGCARISPTSRATAGTTRRDRCSSRAASAGWSWCIPLQERLSIGIVLGQDDAARLGRTPEERLERAITTDSWLSSIAGDAKRVTSVATYSNYQLISERGHGPGWVMVGDAFGFVDPMLSPGVFLALRSAELLADASGSVARARARSRRAPSWTRRWRHTPTARRAMLSAWLELVAYLYDGRLAR